jgi:DNA-binding winged helix-turn-helix (wHTH) protein
MSGASNRCRTTIATRFIATVAGQGYRFIPTFSNLGWGGEAHTREDARD